MHTSELSFSKSLPTVTDRFGLEESIPLLTLTVIGPDSKSRLFKCMNEDNPRIKTRVLRTRIELVTFCGSTMQ